MMSKAAKFYQSLFKTSPKEYPIRDIFEQFFPIYALSHTPSSEQSKAARCITECKTGSLGYNVSYCESCGHVEVHACSCNNRNCPCCQSPQEQKWIMARNLKLIERCAYYHSIFTVPFELNDLIYANQKLLYNLMFSCASDTLLTLCRDKQHMGATPGIILVLHTWGQQLNFHPHIHCCLSGGGLTESKQFIESRHKGFLLPVEAIGKMFRGKFMEKLKIYYDNALLNFTHKCSNLRNSYCWKEFVELFLQHILPKGFSRVRFSGFLSNCCKTKKLKLIHKLRGTVFIPNPVNGKSMAELLMLLYKKDICTCPECKGCIIPYPRGRPANIAAFNCSLA